MSRKTIRPAGDKSPLVLKITEREWARQVVQIAKMFGWKYYHTWTSINSAPGFPDYVFVHRDKRRVVFAELKSERGKVSEAQQDWLDALKEAGAEVYLWRPSDIEKVAEVLQK